MKTNPLLSTTRFPLFEQLKSEHILPALEQVLENNRVQIRLISERPEGGWSDFAEPLENLGEEIEHIWSPVSHLNSVKDADALRKQIEKALPMLSTYSTEIGQNNTLYQKFKTLAASAEFKQLTQAQRTTIENEIRDFELSGVGLNEQDKDSFKNINAELVKYCQQYEQNVLDATQAWSLHITEGDELAGLPEQVVQAAAQSAEEASLNGWRFTLHAPSYIPFMTYADNRALRKQMYEAYATRASDRGPDAGKWDNTLIMQNIVRLRREKSALLGFKDYAEYSLQTKMADRVEEVEEFLRDLSERSRPAAEKEWATLNQFSREQGGPSTLQAWDAAYYSEKLKQQLFDFSDESLRPYFPLDKVLQGLFDVVRRLFGMQVVSAERPEVWHNDVQFFEILDENNARRGWFYLDLYAREHKRGGAWMADCTNRRKTEDGIQYPVAFMTCNFAKPVGDKPALLRHDDVITLFHEFGHGLHHMLTQVDVSSVAGISGVPWDAVELPSQFLENWCWQREALDLISGHVDSGEALPDVLLQKMLDAKNFQAAMQMLRQIEFSLFDIRLYQNTDETVDIQAVLNHVRKQVAIVEPPSFNRFAHGFSHIFAGGYAAGYYSYKWAEVLSSDAFSRFEDEGVFNPQTGRDFLHHILERGGSEQPMELFKRFRGRKPKIEPLLQHSGLI